PPGFRPGHVPGPTLRRAPRAVSGRWPGTVRMPRWPRNAPGFRGVTSSDRATSRNPPHRRKRRIRGRATYRKATGTTKQESRVAREAATSPHPRYAHGAAVALPDGPGVISRSAVAGLADPRGDVARRRAGARTRRGRFTSP